MKKIIVLLFSFAVLFGACKKSSNNEPKPITPTSMDDLDISQSFDWKTTKDYSLTVTGNKSNIVEVKSETGVTYQRAFLNANEPYSTKITVPSYEKTILLKFLGQEVILELNGSNLNYQFQ